MDRGRANVTVDIRTDAGRAFCIDACNHADVLIEGFRPGVMERLGLGPDVLTALNPRLIYGRITGWGQSGPLSRIAGHDINFIAVAGALDAMGRSGEPAMPPLNLVGDFGGGSMFLAFGILAALLERERSGKGQVVDAAIVDGVSSLLSMFSGLLPSRRISMDRDENVLGGAAPFYRSYLCSDGKEIAIGALEPRFYGQLLECIGAPAHLHENQNDPSSWLDRSDLLAEIFRSRTSEEWCALLEATDTCFAPVLSLEEAPRHSQLEARSTYIEHDGIRQPAPAPRFSRTNGSIQGTRDGHALLAAWRSAGANAL
jgi:alpha-methylacyl-CoA racemase